MDLVTDSGWSPSVPAGEGLGLMEHPSHPTPSQVGLVSEDGPLPETYFPEIKVKICDDYQILSMRVIGTEKTKILKEVV